jgi:hypothetical protein
MSALPPKADIKRGLRLAQQLQQLGDVDRNPAHREPRLRRCPRAVDESAISIHELGYLPGR